MLETAFRSAEAAAEATAPAIPALMSDLFAALRERGVRYCHWKSNLRLIDSLLGKTDLDLLVDPAHQEVFRQILREHGARAVRAARGREYPAVENYLAFDEGSGRLFHLHVHYQLVLGEQFVKNYRLPLEEQFLRSARLRHGVYVPSVELELIVLSLRALLKYRDRDVVKDVLKIRHPGLPAHITGEIGWLRGQTSLERVAAQLGELGDSVPRDTVLEFLRAVEREPRAGRTLLRLRGEVRRALRPFQRAGRGRATLVYFRELWRRRNRLRLAPSRGMTLPDGGRTVGLIGADGAGKSTLCAELHRWLAWKLEAPVYYLGSKQPSRRSEALYMLFRAARRGQRALSAALGAGSPPARAAAAARQTLLCFHCLSIGYDRYARYLAGRAQARAGAVAIFDRYPLEAISARADHRLLDGPQIPRLVGEGGPIIRALAAAELRLYRKMPPPDQLFVLHVSPDVSLRRKPDHQRDSVAAKSQALRDLEGAAGVTGLVSIDADQPLADVLGRLKAQIWRVLA
jgi:hypothetical protein